MEELVKYKHLIRNDVSPLEKKEKNVPKIKALLAGIQICKQLLLTKAQSIYSFDNFDELTSNLNNNYKNSLENLITSSLTSIKKSPSHKVMANSQFDNKNNKISSYLNIVTTQNLQQQEADKQITSSSAIKQQMNNYNTKKPNNVFDTNLKCISAYVSDNNNNNCNNNKDFKKTTILPTKVTNECAEFDINYPPTKIDIFYPRAKINICSDTPQIDLNLPDPLIEYKSYCANIKHKEGIKKCPNTSELTGENASSDANHKYSNFYSQSFKPTLTLESSRNENLNFKRINDGEKGFYKNLSNNLRQTTKGIAETIISKNNLKTSLELNSCRQSTINTPSCGKLNKNHELETENFIQAMISSDCGLLLQQLLQKYMLLDKSCKKGDIAINSKILEYNEWLKANYSVSDTEASRIQKYIETWYINCMLEKLSLDSK